jgi:TonB-linked SusC/RagA family outer membrane protein
MKIHFLKNIKSLFVLMIGLQMSAQNIKGVVLGESEPLPGATVLVKGTNNGTTTDFDGNFSIQANQDDILVISFIGFLTQEVEIGNQSNLTISLLQDVLEEVVVTGYGTQKKEEITSSIVSISSEDFNGGNINDPTQLLQGKIAGLNVARVGSNPNEEFTLRLRGLSTFGANAEPLVIIDGVTGGSLNSVDPADIESINVLKDAAAAAIYGTRGSSGVIIITTKTAKGGAKSGFEYRGYLSSEQISNRIQYASYDDFLSYGGNDLGSKTDWVDEVTRTAMSNVHNLAYSGSSENGLGYRVSLNVRDIEGIQTTSGFEQINGRVNVNQKLLDDKLRLQASFGMTSRDASNGFERALTSAQSYNPTAPIYNSDGTFFQNVGVDRSYNPVAINEQSVWDLDTNTMLANFKVDYDLTSNLTVSASYSSQFKTMTDSKYYDNDATWVGLRDVGRAEKTISDEKFNLSEFTATYNGDLNDLNYEVLAGYAYQEFIFSNQYAYNTNFLTNEPGYNGIGLGLGIKDGQAGITSLKEESKLASTFARLNLNYQNLAFFSASFRNEQSSRFGANNRSGNFWATSAGVDFNRLFDINGLDQLKLRVGYGTTGNEPNQRYAYLATLGTATNPEGNIVNGYVNGNYVTALGPASNPNPDLKWEEKTELNIGIDFIALNSKLSGNIDYFVRNTTDLLRVTPVSSPPNIFSSTLLNLGELDTKGFEIALNYSAVSTADLQWDVAFNIANFDVTLVNLSDQDDFIAYSGRLPGNLNTTYPIVLQEGERLGNIRAGIFAGYDSDGRTLIINQETGQPTTDRDLNRDGVIVGNALPDYTFGLNNTLTYKDWDLNIMLRGATGHSLVNVPRMANEYSKLSAKNFVKTKLFDAENNESGGIYHSGHVEKADYLRLDNATIGYNIKMSESSKIDNLRLYVAGNNLFTVTNYTGADPEVRYTERSWVQGNEIDTTIDILSPGLDKLEFGYFPTAVYTIGANISF